MAERLSERARSAAGKIERTKNMVLYYLLNGANPKVVQDALRASNDTGPSQRSNLGSSNDQPA